MDLKYYYYELHAIDTYWGFWYSMEDAEAKIIEEWKGFKKSAQLQALKDFFFYAEKFQDAIQYPLRTMRVPIKVTYMPFQSDGWMLPLFMCKEDNNGATYLGCPFPLDATFVDSITGGINPNEA